MTTAYEDPHAGTSVLDGLTEEPWRDVPPEEAQWMRPHLPDLLGPMVRGVLRHVPEYDRPGDAAYCRVAEAAVAHAMEHFVHMIADPDASWKEVYQVFFDVGYGEAVEGRSLEHLQNAMRVGSRLAWRHLAVEAERLGRPRAMVSLLAEANFAYLDALASAAAHGYARAREKAAGEREQRRGRLLALLLSDPPAPAEAVREQSAHAGWPLPKRMAVIVLRPRPGSGGEGPAGLPPSLLTGLDHGRPCLIVPDPDGPGRMAELTATLAGWTGAIGPSVPVDQAGTSLLWARRALDLAAPEPATSAASAGGSAGGSAGRSGAGRRAGRAARRGPDPGRGARPGTAAAGGRDARRDRGVPAAGPAGRGRAAAGRAARRDAAGVHEARLQRHGRRRGAVRAPADRALPAGAVARHVRLRHRGPGDPAGDDAAPAHLDRAARRLIRPPFPAPLPLPVPPPARPRALPRPGIRYGQGRRAGEGKEH